MRALVVDDSKPSRSILCRMLRELGFETTEACNGREALVCLKQLGKPDLVTVNWNMPVLDGIEFIQAVRSDVRFRELLLLMISVESDPEKVAMALGAGANEYVVKPFTKQQLIDTLQGLGVSVASSRTGPSPSTAAPKQGPIQRVLIVDDSVVIRRTLANILDEDPQLQVIGTAADCRIALDKVRQDTPDVILLDIEMPNMDGFETLKALRQTHPRLPVIMFSALTERGAAATLDAMLLGANDYVSKPTNLSSFNAVAQRIREELIPKIKQFVPREKPAGRATGVSSRPKPERPKKNESLPIEIVLIGVSTGGPAALARLLPSFAADCPVPVVIVQHMPPVFTRRLAERLAGNGKLNVHEGTSGQPLTPGEIIIAPGDHHAVVTRRGNELSLVLNQDPPENSCRPSVDVLFRSAASVCQAGVLAVVLTGMGKDGLNGCQRIAQAGGQVFVQDEATSVVWGMPGHVANAGLADKVLPLQQLGKAIKLCTWRKRRRAP